MRFTIRNDLRELARVNELASTFLERHGACTEAIYVTNLALEESLSNVIRYAYDDALEHEISVSLHLIHGSVELQVVDDGNEFNPLSVAEVDVEAPLEERRVGGLGVHLLRKLTSGIHYERTALQNRLLVRVGKPAPMTIPCTECVDM